MRPQGDSDLKEKGRPSPSPPVETLTWEEVFEDPYDERSED